jgi:hypothetical protein
VEPGIAAEVGIRNADSGGIPDAVASTSVSWGRLTRAQGRPDRTGPHIGRVPYVYESCRRYALGTAGIKQASGTIRRPDSWVLGW